MRRRGGPGRRGPGPGRRPAARRSTRRRVQRKQRRRRRRRVMLVGGLIAFGAYKFSKRDSERIEEHTGQPVDQLTDEELEKAMADLNIEKQTVTEEEQQYIDAQDDPDDDEEYVEEEPSYLDELERLAKLKDQGIITEEDFVTKKKQLLGL